MVKKSIDTVDIRMGVEYFDKVLQILGTGYKNPYRVFGEYIQNSIDSAIELKNESGKDEFPYPIEIRVDIDSKTNDVNILDNCEGMDIKHLKKVATIFSSKKRNERGVRGHNGIGVHIFRSYFNKITIKTKRKGSDLLEMSFQRGVDNINGIPIYGITGEDFPHESGTLITLSELDPTGKKKYDVPIDKLREMIDLRFRKYMEPNLKITAFEDGE